MVLHVLVVSRWPASPQCRLCRAQFNRKGCSHIAYAVQIVRSTTLDIFVLSGEVTAAKKWILNEESTNLKSTDCDW